MHIRPKKANRKKVDLTPGNIWALKYYTFSINDLLHRPPLKKWEQSWKKIQARAFQGHIPWLNLKKISRSVFHNMQITTEPLCSDPCAMLKIQIPMHSISWGCLKIVCRCNPVSLLTHLASHLEAGCKSHGQIIHYRTAKNVTKQVTVLFYFYMNFDPGGISCSLTRVFEADCSRQMGLSWKWSFTKYFCVHMWPSFRCQMQIVIVWLECRIVEL